MDPKFHPGDLSLPKLQEQCQAFQNLTPARLVDLQGVEVETPAKGQTKFNKGTYAELGDLDKVPQLKFVQVDDPNKIPSLIADALQEKFSILFDKTLFVSNAEQRVLGFGKT